MILSHTHKNFFKKLTLKKPQNSSFLHYYKALNENIFNFFHISYMELLLAES